MIFATRHTPFEAPLRALNQPRRLELVCQPHPGDRIGGEPLSAPPTCSNPLRVTEIVTDARMAKTPKDGTVLSP